MNANRSPKSGVAAMEFAFVAPLMVVLVWGVYDVSRALVAWEQTYHAAEAIAQAAEKLSVTNTNNPNGTPITSLTASQMQDAMSSIYAEMPWLNLGNGTGALTGSYSVTLSGVEYFPRCPANATNTCAPQAPNVLWSTYLNQGGTQLLTPGNTKFVLYRLCLPAPIAAAQFPNNNTQLLYMIDPTLVKNGVQNLNLIPQVVADVQYNFVPSFPLLANKTFTFWASASFPAPLGGDDQAIVFNATGSGGNGIVENCPNGGAT